MKAALWLGKGKIEVASIGSAVPGRSEVLLRVLTAGVCGTDLSIYAAVRSQALRPADGPRSRNLRRHRGIGRRCQRVVGR